MFNPQLHRIILIDKALNSVYMPTKDDLIEYIRDNSDDFEFCDSTIEKDLYLMRNQYNAPIKFKKGNSPGGNGFYYYSDDFEFWHEFLSHWNKYIEFPVSIRNILITNNYTNNEQINK